MEQYEYEVTKHGERFFKTMVYFCTPEGDCDAEEAQTTDGQTLLKIFNERGKEGWELVQLLPGEEAAVAFWKRKLLFNIPTES